MMKKLNSVFRLDEAPRKYPRAGREGDDVGTQPGKLSAMSSLGRAGMKKNVARYHEDFNDAVDNAITSAGLGDDRELVGAVKSVGEMMVMRLMKHYETSEGTDIQKSLDKLTASIKDLIDEFTVAETEIEALTKDDSEKPTEPQTKATGTTSPRSMGMRRMA